MLKSTKALPTTSRETAINKSNSSERRQPNSAYRSQQPIVPNENSVRPVADVILRRTAKLKQFADLLESGEGNSPMHPVQESAIRDDFKGPIRGST